MIEGFKGAITYAKGFKAAGIRAGIKQSGEDMALIVSDVPSCAAGVFTLNVVKAACVTINRSRLPSETIRAILVNAGNANSYTGAQGHADALETADRTSKLLGVSPEDVLIASTGVIGHLLPMEIMRSGIDLAAGSLSADGGEDAARAIMTTDTFPKEAAAEVVIGGKPVRIGGICKGAGMICPNMATMLAFITTDAAIAPHVLQKCLTQAVNKSFNCVTIDGDSSTNDMALILANGAAGNPMLSADSPDLAVFQDALDAIGISLAKQIARDGEGATKMIEITVAGTETSADAAQIAKTIANSPLFKTMMFGNDPNWGRVLAAAGRAGVDFDPSVVNLRFGDIDLVRAGEPVDFPQNEAHALLKNPEVKVRIEVGAGPGEATVWTCDFSYDYVKINAEYHT
ncbi:MAG: bifunctional glutamate N-acetyltransferase/amino-acid acetyltransferase ArgJ [Armatimonadota bacterium]